MTYQMTNPEILLPNFEAYQDETVSGWWIPSCEDPALFAAYKAVNDPVFVDEGDPVPAGEASISPEVLAQVAYESMDLPKGTIRWNPSLVDVSGATLVNMDTWVWVENAPTSVSVTAEIPGTWARVDATFARMTLSAPGADSSTCATTGVPWQANTEPPCSLVFFHSSANQPVKDGYDLPTATLSGTASWASSWVSSLNPTPTVLAPQDVVTTAEIPVAEIQTIVTYG